MSEILGGITPRIMPVLDVREAGGLLQRAGFALPVTDSGSLGCALRASVEVDARFACDEREQYACWPLKNFFAPRCTASVM